MCSQLPSWWRPKFNLLLDHCLYRILRNIVDAKDMPEYKRKNQSWLILYLQMQLFSSKWCLVVVVVAVGVLCCFPIIFLMNGGQVLEKKKYKFISRGLNVIAGRPQVVFCKPGMVLQGHKGLSLSWILLVPPSSASGSDSDSDSVHLKPSHFRHIFFMEAGSIV